MAKRTHLKVNTGVLATAAAARGNATTEAPSTAGKFQTTGVSFPPDVLELLNDVAQRRKKLRGGRASVSAILLELVERHRAELEAELR